MSKKFLLTGATGFVGRQILKNLINKRYEVRVVVRKNKEIFLKNKNLKIEVITMSSKCTIRKRASPNFEKISCALKRS